MDSADLWVDTYVGPVRADQIVHVGTNKPQLVVYTAVVPADIEKVTDERWYAEPHWYGVWASEDDGRYKVVARELVREITRRRRAEVPGIIQIDRASGAVSFIAFD